MRTLMLLLLAGVLASCVPSTPDARIAASPTKYENLSSKHKELVRQGRIDTGMSPDAVSLAWGSPDRSLDGEEGEVNTSRWDYTGSRPVYTTRYGGGYHYGRGRYGRYSGYGLSFGPQVTYVPYRKASVWFRNDRVTKWERVR